MPRLHIAAVLLIGLIGAHLQLDQLFAQDVQGWGHISGRVVFAGDRKNPVVQQHQQALPIHAPISLRQSLRGVRGKKIDEVENRSLLIDEQTRGIGNVFVYSKTRPQRIHPDLESQSNDVDDPQELTFKDHLFTPRAFVIRPGQTLQFANADNHSRTNFQTNFFRNDNVNVLVESQATKSIVPTAPEKRPSRIASSIEPTAEAWMMVADHPYVVVSEKDGSFAIRNLPAGKHSLTLWHEATGYINKTLEVDVVAGKTTTLPDQHVTVDQIKG